MAKKYFSGFTLVELMIVIAIIAIMAALFIMFLPGQISKGNDARRKADINRIKIAVEEYEKDHNCYPQSVSCKSPSTLRPYLNQIPCDPTTHEPYGYDYGPVVGSCPEWYRLYAYLDNSQDPQIIFKIGPGGAYNYYSGSPNAPTPESNSGYWGCINGECSPLQVDSSGHPYCKNAYTSNNCNSNCFGPDNINPNTDCSR